MAEYNVSLDAHINVHVAVEADCEEEAKELAVSSFLNGEYECKDPICDPVVGWAEVINQIEED